MNKIVSMILIILWNFEDLIVFIFRDYWIDCMYWKIVTVVREMGFVTINLPHLLTLSDVPVSTSTTGPWNTFLHFFIVSFKSLCYCNLNHCLVWFLHSSHLLLDQYLTSQTLYHPDLFSQYFYQTLLHKRTSPPNMSLV